MNKIDFKNLPDTTTPLSAENLNLLQDNVEDAIPVIDSAVSTNSTNGVENQAITNYVNDKLTYSTTQEVVIGTYDSKPLYRKTIKFPNGTGQNTEKVYNLSDLGITNVDEIWVGNPSYYTYNGGIRWPFSLFDGNTYLVGVEKTKLHITITTNVFYTSLVVVTLEYTKTTD